MTCAGCSKPCSSRQAPYTGDEEKDLQAQLEIALERAKRAEQAFEKLQSENLQNTDVRKLDLKPLRSQQWFNNR